MEYTGRAYNVIIPKDVLQYSNLKHEFYRLKENWLKGTAHLADPGLVYQNQYYQTIVELGRQITPFLFKDLFAHDTDWLDALAQIYGVDPVRIENYGNFDAMVNDWKEWKSENNA